MNESRNMILAIVLSALVLLGWTLASNKYLPDRRPSSTEGREGPAAPLAAAQGAAGAAKPQALRSRGRGPGATSARPDQDARRCKARST